MKQYRNTNYYVTEEGQVFKYWPKRIYKYNYSQHYNSDKIYTHTIEREEKYKPLKSQIGNHGYKFVRIYSQPGKGKIELIHRLVAECYLGPCPKGKEVDHIDGNPLNNHISNLQYLTPEENKAKRFNPCLSKQHSK